jgi:hypothetical protein
MLRRKAGALPARFTTPAGVVVAAAALLLSAWLLSSTTGRQARDTGIAAVIGLLIYYLPKWLRRPA